MSFKDQFLYFIFAPYFRVYIKLCLWHLVGLIVSIFRELLMIDITYPFMHC